MANFVMPKLGADMTAGTLVQWRKKPGELVQRGDVIAEVETDKGNIDIEVFSGGVIEQLLVRPGDKVPVGAVLAVLREEGAPTQAAAPVPKSEPTVAPAPEPVLAPISSSAPAPQGR